MSSLVIPSSWKKLGTNLASLISLTTTSITSTSSPVIPGHMMSSTSSTVPFSLTAPQPQQFCLPPMLQLMTGRQNLSLLCEKVTQWIFKGVNLVSQPLELLSLLLPHHTPFQLQCKVLKCMTTHLRHLCPLLAHLLIILLTGNRILQPSLTLLLHSQSPNQGPKSKGNKLLLMLMLKMEWSSLSQREHAGTEGLRSNICTLLHCTPSCNLIASTFSFHPTCITNS